MADLLEQAVNVLRDMGLPEHRISTLLKMKLFDGQTLVEVARAGKLEESHIDFLVHETQAMDAAYERSGLARSKAKPTSDWQAYISIPGTLE